MKRLLLLLFNKPPKWHTICTLFQKLCSLSEQKPKKTELHREPPICTCRSAIYRRAEERTLLQKFSLICILSISFSTILLHDAAHASADASAHTHTLKTAAAVFLLFPFSFLFTSHFSSFYTVFLSCSFWFSHSLSPSIGIYHFCTHSQTQTDSNRRTNTSAAKFFASFFGVCFH